MIECPLNSEELVTNCINPAHFVSHNTADSELMSLYPISTPLHLMLQFLSLGKSRQNLLVMVRTSCPLKQ